MLKGVFCLCFSTCPTASLLLVLQIVCLNFSMAQNNALVLNGALTILNGGTTTTPIYMVVNQNNPLGIVRNSGHINSENQYNYIKWESGSTTGNYVFPFGIGSNTADYIPFTFNKTTAGASDIQLSTWFTNTPNFPRPATTNVGAVTSMTGTADSVLFAIDRFWDIQSTATADLTFSYRGIENTTIAPTDTVKAQHWNGVSWDAPVGPGNFGLTTGIGTAGPFMGQNTFSPWILSLQPQCPSATISYSSTTFCNNINISQPITQSGTTGGTYSATPVGLSINTSNGAIIPSTSTPGTYTVSYNVNATTGCNAFNTTVVVTITNMDNPSFSYTSNKHCITGANPTATVSGTTGGIFTISGSGVINPATGEINLLASGLGSYTVTYNTASAGNPCSQASSIVINITNAPSATFSYNSALYCQNAAAPILTFGAGSSAGVFSSTPAGLTLNSSSGTVTLSSSSSGSYTIYNTIAASGGCADAIDSINITITPSFLINQTIQICQGDSIFLAGAFQTTNDIYTNTLATVNGCDSIISTTLTVNPTTFIQTTAAICQGDSVFLAGAYQQSSGIYTDTLTAINGCDSIIETNLTVTPIPLISMAPVSPVCFGSPLVLTATSNATGTINWYTNAAGTNSIGTGSPFITSTPLLGNVTYYAGLVGVCSSGIDSVTVNIIGVTAAINASPENGIAPLTVNFGNNSTSGAGITYYWDFDNGNTSAIFEPSNIYLQSGNYTSTLIVTDGTCSDTATILITVIDDSAIIFPNVFTPNDDGVNDVFIIPGKNLIEVKVEIFNRWGELLYVWDAPKGSWDGRTTAGVKAPDGTYLFIINAKGIDGKEYSKQGTFLLIR